ncbi:DUF4167 domain-containing protein [Croceicoccus esteveae]|uniref:DUF4167 domain-containing protein n=1 Tax=Croceicoccus esteveae TaxID=3075597 RepID=UPI003D777C2E
MNNTRGNNRRRGRSPGRQQGGQFQNRIDSRARGNAPQLLDKYKKLAEDAHRNGDRVQAEYYLQFADHYFRVIADGKVRQDEQRSKREDTRDDPRQDGNSRRDERRGTGSHDDDDSDADSGSADEEMGGRDDRFISDHDETSSAPANHRTGRPVRNEADDDSAQDTRRQSGEESDNPFVREPRKRAVRKPRQPSGRGEAAGSETERTVQNSGALDPQALPPAIGETGTTDGEPAEKPKRARRPRKPKEDGSADDVKQAANG